MTERNYICIVKQDAWINHECIVPASSPEQAAERALAVWHGSERNAHFIEVGTDRFDDVQCIAQDCEPEEEKPIDDTTLPF